MYYPVKCVECVVKCPSSCSFQQDGGNYTYSQYHNGRKEGRNVLFNDDLNTFYFTVIWRQTYG